MLPGDFVIAAFEGDQTEQKLIGHFRRDDALFVFLAVIQCCEVPAKSPQAAQYDDHQKSQQDQSDDGALDFWFRSKPIFLGSSIAIHAILNFDFFCVVFITSDF